MGPKKTSRGIAALAAILTTMLGATAQSIGIVGGPVVAAGQVAVIAYKNASMAGQEVTVEITGGFPATTETVTIKLDANGVGTANWTPNTNWSSATLTGPGASVGVTVSH